MAARLHGSRRSIRRNSALLSIAALAVAAWIVAQVAAPGSALLGASVVSADTGGSDGGGRPAPNDHGGPTDPPVERRGMDGDTKGGGDTGRAPVTGTGMTDPGASGPPPKQDGETTVGKSSQVSSKASKARLAWLAAQSKARRATIPGRLLAEEEREWLDGVLLSIRRGISSAGPAGATPAVAK